MNNGLMKEWFSSVPKDLLAGLAIAMGLIPEALAFSVIAGVDLRDGLYASVCIAVVTAVSGGRRGIISGATAAMALLMRPLIKEHGLEYLLTATVLTVLVQILSASLRLGNVVNFVPRSVMTGFLNALAIMILMAQTPSFQGVGAGWPMIAMVAVGLAIIYILPRFMRMVPAPLVSVIVLTVLAVSCGMGLRTVGDMGSLPLTTPTFLFPQAPFQLATLWIIVPYAISVATVGLLESVMAAVVVDDNTESGSEKNRECVQQRTAKIMVGCPGGMAACTMAGQTMVTKNSSARGWLSTFAAGFFLLIFIVASQAWVQFIPMAALVAVMITVSVNTFKWSSLTELSRAPAISSMVMIVTVVVVMLTNNLASGVLAGVLLNALYPLIDRCETHKDDSLRAETSDV